MKRQSDSGIPLQDLTFEPLRVISYRMERHKKDARVAIIDVLAQAESDAASKGASNASDYLREVATGLTDKWWPKTQAPGEKAADAHLP